MAAVLVHRAVGDRLTCIFVDHGLLRLHEREQVEHTFRRHLRHRPPGGGRERARSWRDLAGVSRSGERSARRIGHTFIDVFEAGGARRSGDDVGFLVQGTLYPDVIESMSPLGGPSVTIKTHHNVGGLPERLPFKLIEPLRELFKDEVRQVGRELGLPEEMVGRHPFPGPGLAIRILGEVSRAELDILRAGRRTSTSRRSARRGSTTRSGRRSRCCSRSARWACRATTGPTTRWSRSAR